MALFHLSVTQTKRSAGQSAIASAAYRAGERLYSEYYGEYSDYTRKGGVICSDILLPSHAPKEYADRQTLWNAVEKAERGKNAQLAYSFDIALQNEFSLEENIALARQFLLENFVSRGMVVDFAVHQPDREDGGIPNPHFHVLCPIRPIEQKRGKDGKVFIDTLMLPPCLVPSYRHRPMMNSHRAFFIYRRILNEQYRNQHRHLPDCQKADRQDHLYRPCPFQRDRQGDDGGQNQAYAPCGSPQNVTSF